MSLIKSFTLIIGHHLMSSMRQSSNICDITLGRERLNMGIIFILTLEEVEGTGRRWGHRDSGINLFP